MAYPETIDQKTVHDIHYREDDKHLPETGTEVPRAIDTIDTYKNIQHVSRNADHFKALTVPADLFMRGQTQLHTAVLHILMIEMHHPDGAVTNPDCTDHHQ